MNDFGLFAARDPARVERILHTFERYAVRRERSISALDLDALDRTTALRILQDDEEIAETLCSAVLYLRHLYALEEECPETEADISLVQ